MSSLWTPDGERPVGPPRSQPSKPPSSPSGPTSPTHPPGGVQGSGSGGASGGILGGPGDDSPLDEAGLEALRQQLAGTPAEVVVANHAFGLFELAALHLSVQPPQLDQARLAIDAVGALVEGLGGRLGEAESTLAEGLAQLRLAFVQIRQAAGAPATPGTQHGTGANDAPG